MTESNTSNPSAESSNAEQSFLAQINLLRKEIQEVVEQKMNSLLTTGKTPDKTLQPNIQPPMLNPQQQYFTMFNPPQQQFTTFNPLQHQSSMSNPLQQQHLSMMFNPLQQQQHQSMMLRHPLNHIPYAQMQQPYLQCQA